MRSVTIPLSSGGSTGGFVFRGAGAGFVLTRQGAASSTATPCSEALAVSALTPAPNTAIITWGKSLSGALSYQVTYSLAGGASVVAAASTSSLRQVLSGLTPNTTYEAGVAAIDADGLVGRPTTVSFTTPAAVRWVSPVTGFWEDGLNWEKGSAPCVNQHPQLLNTTGDYDAILTTAKAVRSLTLTGVGQTLRLRLGSQLRIVSAARALELAGGETDGCGVQPTPSPADRRRIGGKFRLTNITPAQLVEGHFQQALSSVLAPYAGTTSLTSAGITINSVTPGSAVVDFSMDVNTADSESIFCSLPLVGDDLVGSMQTVAPGQYSGVTASLESANGCADCNCTVPTAPTAAPTPTSPPTGAPTPAAGVPTTAPSLAPTNVPPPPGTPTLAPTGAPTGAPTIGSGTGSGGGGGGGGGGAGAAIGAVIGVLVIIAIVVFLLYRRKQKRENGGAPLDALELRTTRGNAADGGMFAMSGAAGATGTLGLGGKWEIERHQLQMGETLGMGYFGNVRKGLYTNPRAVAGMQRLTVAVRVLPRTTTSTLRDDFKKEIHLLQRLGSDPHENVLGLVGVSISKEPNLILVPFLEHGSLSTYLRESRATRSMPQSLGMRELLEFAQQVASGMKYLASPDVAVVHKNLQAATVLVDANNQCKVSDFGRDPSRAYPVRWMAPECLAQKTYSTKTDVWAFGVTLWEIVTLAATPYGDKTMSQIRDFIDRGSRLTCPPDVPNSIYRVMTACWEATPSNRPTFDTLVNFVSTAASSVDIPVPGAGYTYLPVVGDERRSSFAWLPGEGGSSSGKGWDSSECE